MCDDAARVGKFGDRRLGSLRLCSLFRDLKVSKSFVVMTEDLTGSKQHQEIRTTITKSSNFGVPDEIGVESGSK